MADLKTNSEKAGIHLYELPDNVLELICQLLIDDASCQEYLDHVRTLRDVMNLRAACSSLNGVIKAMVLYMPCSITSEWVNFPENQSYFNFIDFMRTDTNWRFRSLQIKAKMMIKDYDLLPVFHKNEKLFYKSLKRVKIWLNMANYYETITDVLLDWLKTVALKAEAKVELHFATLNFTISEPELVTKLVITEIENELIPAELWLYSNLSELRLNDIALQVDCLIAFPKLKVLEVENLFLSDLSSISSTPRFHTIKSLIIGSKRTINAEQLPIIISQLFPSLICFEFSGYLNSVDFSNLPKTCIFVRTRLSSLRYFVKSKGIKNIALYYDGVLASMQNDINFESGEVSVLKIIFHDYHLPVTFRELVKRIIDVLSVFRSLEVLSLSVRFGRDGTADASIQKLIRGEIDLDFIDLLRDETELRQFCSDCNLQLLVLGKVTLMKTSATSALLRSVDNFESEHGWILRPGPGVILPMELVTSK